MTHKHRQLLPVIDPGDLEGLLLSCHRNGRLPKFPTQEVKYFTDAERFRWWFRYGCDSAGLLGARPLESGRTLQKIRDWMDAEMRKHPEQVHL